MTAHPEQIAALDQAAEVFRELGAEVREIRLAPLDQYATCTRIIIRCEAFAIHRPWLAARPDDYGDLARQRILDGAVMSAADYIDALRLRARLTRQTLAAFAGIDVALTASNMDPACPIDDAEACARLYPRQARQPFNVTGQPALAMPAGFSREGLPLSLQLIGHPFQEAMVYRVAQAYESATRVDRAAPAGDLMCGRLRWGNEATRRCAMQATRLGSRCRRLAWSVCAGAPSAAASEVKVLTAGAMRGVVDALLPDFEKATGHKITVDNATAGDPCQAHRRWRGV